MTKKTIDLGPSEELKATSDLVDAEWNFVLIHRSTEPIVSWWGNRWGNILRRIIIRADDEKPIRWYHRKIFAYATKQYDTYGDYYRILDNSFGTPDADTIYEETND